MIEGENPTLIQVLTVWIIANFVPQLIIYIAVGKPYFSFNVANGMITEIIIMTWNMLLAIWALTYWNNVRRSRIRDALAWHMYGWRTIGWGIVGFIITFLVFLVISLAFGPSIAYAGGEPINLPPLIVFALVSGHSIAIPLGEEVMFRGYIQTGIGRRYGPKEGLLVGALLFSLRHHPADLYYGWGAPLTQWVSRLLQLYIGALIWGWIRHRSNSIISTLITHILFILLPYLFLFI